MVDGSANESHQLPRRLYSRRSSHGRSINLAPTSDANSLDSNASVAGSNKLEEDVQFPMDQVLMSRSIVSDVQVNELDLLRLPEANRPTLSRSKKSEEYALHSSAVSIDSSTSTDWLEEHESKFSFYAASMNGTIHASNLGLLVKEGQSFQNLFNSDNGVWWLDCHNISEQEMRILSRAFSFHPLTTEDIMSQDSLEKFEMFKNYGFVAYKTFDHELNPVGFYIVVLKEGVITFHFSDTKTSKIYAHSRRVRARMRQLYDWVKVSPIWITYALIDDITDSFLPDIDQIQDEAGYVEKAVYVDNGASEIAVLLGRLGHARQRTMALVRLLYGKADVLSGFIKRCQESSSTVVSGAVDDDSHHSASMEVALYLDDIKNRLETMKENLMSYEGILSRSHNSYMGILQVEYVNSNTRMTSLLGKVTIIATILVPMNLVFGAWGMNVPVPGGGSEGLGWFFGIIAVTFFIVIMLGILSYWYFVRTVKTSRSITYS